MRPPHGPPLYKRESDMNPIGTLERLSLVSYEHRRRLQVWALGLSIILSVLLVQMLHPRIRILPGIVSTLTPATMLGVFLMALVCEYVDSSLGMGYGTALTPLLLLLFGFAPLEIVPCVLLSEFITGVWAAAMHQRDGNVDLLRDREARATAVLLSVLSGVGAFTAVMFAVRVPNTVMTVIISIIVLAVGILTLATAGRRLRYRRGHMIALGTVAAFNKGFSGGGYGPLVTAGQVVSGLAPKKAVAVTSLAESMTCFIGLIAYFAAGQRIDWAIAIPLTLGAVFSVPIATLTVKRAPETLFRTGVGLATCILGILALVKLL